MREKLRELRPVQLVDADLAAQQAVKAAVLLRWDRGGKSKAEAQATLELLEALGLQPYTDGGQYTPTGKLQNRGRPRSDQPAGDGEAAS